MIVAAEWSSPPGRRSHPSVVHHVYKWWSQWKRAYTRKKDLPSMSPYSTLRWERRPLSGQSSCCCPRGNRCSQESLCCKPDFMVAGHPPARGSWEGLLGPLQSNTFNSTPQKLFFLICLDAIVWPTLAAKGGQGAAEQRQKESNIAISRTEKGDSQASQGCGRLRGP